MSLQSLIALVDDDFAQFNHVVHDIITSNHGVTHDVSKHIIGSGGKRIRSLLLMLMARACGCAGNDHIPSAVAIELFHSATLLHDDVIDGANVRRGQTVAHDIWGSKTSILMGDILFTQAMRLMMRTDDMAKLSVLIDVAETMSKGEVKQLHTAQKQQMSLEDYFEIIEAKTALLFAAAAEIGAMFSPVPNPAIDQARQFGLLMGKAFQLIDDLLDYHADQTMTGKCIGNDLRDKKLTLPFLHAHQWASPAQAEMMMTGLRHGDDRILPDIIAIMHQANTFEHIRSLARRISHEAIGLIVHLPHRPYRQGLIDLMRFVVERDH